jgi:hypothetical protein
MADFKHVEEQIDRLHRADQHSVQRIHGSRIFAEAADTMQALLDENRLLRAEHHAGQYISRNSPDHTWEKWVDACDAADAKLQEQNDD